MLSVGELAEMSLKDLSDLEAKIKMAKVVAHHREGDALREKMEGMAKAAGFSVRDILDAPMARRRPRPTAKYSNPKRPQETWTGMGRRPSWLAAKLKRGVPLETFLTQ